MASNIPSGMHINLTKRQYAFVTSDAFEVLYGGAAGGGKTYGQVVDALLYALKYPKSKQLILRRTFADLDKSIVRTALDVIPQYLWQYNSSSHTGRFVNGSLIDFGYIATDNDVYQYQSAEYDVIRYDELTHFSEFQYIYMFSRVRGANNYPKSIKSTTNPGGVGHTWVKKRWIDELTPDTVKQIGKTTRVFLPAKVQDNNFIMDNDPDYLDRLLMLPDAQRKALLDGSWDIFEGQYFAEFDRSIHVCEPFKLDPSWRRFRAFDYGLDCFACLWFAVTSDRQVYVYTEVSESNLPISQAAIMAVERTDETIYCTYAPPDMWSRAQETGQCKADIFYTNGLALTKSSNDRETGWLAIKELLRIDTNGQARLHIFSSCRELIRCLPMLQIDPRRPTDCLTEPHEITHICDALRGFAISWARPAPEQDTSKRTDWTQDMWQDYYSADAAGKAYMLKKYGKPNGG